MDGIVLQETPGHGCQ